MSNSPDIPQGASLASPPPSSAGETFNRASRVRPRPPANPRDSSATTSRVSESNTRVSSAQSLGSSLTDDLSLRPSSGLKEDHDSSAQQDQPLSAAALSCLPGRILTSKSLSQSVTNPVNPRPSSSVSTLSSTTNSLATKSLMRPSSARKTITSKPNTAGTRVGFRHLWYCCDDDVVSDVLMKDTGMVQSTLDKVHQLLDARYIQTQGRSGGDASVPPSSQLNRLFFTDPSGEQQLVYRLGAVGKGGCLERLSTIMAQVETALGELVSVYTGDSDNSKVKVGFELVSDGTDQSPLYLPDSTSHTALYSRASVFNSLVERVLSLVAMVDGLKSTPETHTRTKQDSHSHTDSETFQQINTKLDALEEMIKSTSSDQQQDVLRPMAPLKSLLTTDPNSSRTVLLRIQHFTEGLEKINEWNSRITEYEQSEQQQMVNELGSTIKQLRNELNDVKSGSKPINTQHTAQSTSDGDDVLELKSQVAFLTKQIESQQVELNSYKSSEKQLSSQKTNNSSEAHEQAVQSFQAEISDLKSRLRKEVLLREKLNDVHFAAMDKIESRLHETRVNYDAKVKAKEVDIQQLQTELSGLETRTTHAETEYLRILDDKQLLQKQMYEQSIVTDAHLVDATANIERAVEKYQQYTGVTVSNKPSSAVDNDVSMLLCVLLGKVDRLKQSTSQIDAISRESQSRKDQEMTQLYDDNKHLRDAAALSESNLDKERSSFIRTLNEIRESIDQNTQEISRLKPKRVGSGTRTSNYSLVDDPVDDAYDTVKNLYRSQMTLVANAYNRQIERLKETKNKADTENIRQVRQLQSTITELQRSQAQTMSKLRSVMQDKH